MDRLYVESLKVGGVYLGRLERTSLSEGDADVVEEFSEGIRYST